MVKFDDGLDGKTTKKHERCYCRNTHVSDCKASCDDDHLCKGYVENTKGELVCQISTTSKCPAGCERKDRGQVGDLTTEPMYGARGDWLCFIKMTGPKFTCNRIIRTIILYPHFLIALLILHF